MPVVPLEEIVTRVLPRVEPGRALSDWEWRTLVAVAEALHDGSPVRIAPTAVADNVEAFLVRGRSRRAFRVRGLLAFLELMPVPSTGRRLTSMVVEERRRFLYEKFHRGHRLHRLCGKVRYLVLMGVYGDPAAIQPTGYVPAEQRLKHRRAQRRQLPVVQARITELGRA